VSETAEAPQDGIADALHDLSDQTRALVQREVNSALHEMWNKAKRGGPAAAFLAAGGVLALLATATAGYGAAAAAAAGLGVIRLRQVPLPFPAETAREAAEAVAEADRLSSRSVPSGQERGT